MKVKWSGVGMVAGSGKLNGSVAARNRGGAYIRTKVTPVNPQTTFQQAQRALLSSLSQAWRALTAAQIAAWNNAVSDWATTDIFGDLRNPSGQQLFVRLNANIASVGGVQISDPPLPAAVPDMAATALAMSVGGGAYDVTYTPPLVATSVQVWATPPISPGISFVKSEYRLISAVAGGGLSPEDIAVPYQARFGVPTVGQKVFVKLVGIDLATGSRGQASSVSTIVVV